MHLCKHKGMTITKNCKYTSASCKDTHGYHIMHLMLGLNSKQLQNLSDKDWAGCSNHLSYVLVIMEKKSNVRYIYTGNSPLLLAFSDSSPVLLSPHMLHTRRHSYWTCECQTWKKSVNVNMRHTILVTTWSH